MILDFLQRQSKKKLEIRFNENRSTMLSVKWDTDCTRVSLHKMFLNAPRNIMEQLACYICKRGKKLHPLLKDYIEKHWSKLDYSRKIRRQKLVVRGEVYDLQNLYDRINDEYFDNRLKLDISWFGNPNRLYRHKITFGSFHAPLRLIKINRILDNQSFPQYLVEFIIYHEMVHFICPSKVTRSGRNSIHTPEFKERERQFKHYRKAQEWIAQNRDQFFIR